MDTEDSFNLGSLLLWLCEKKNVDEIFPTLTGFWAAPQTACCQLVHLRAVSLVRAGRSNGNFRLQVTISASKFSGVLTGNALAKILRLRGWFTFKFLRLGIIIPKVSVCFQNRHHYITNPNNALFFVRNSRKK